MRIIYPFYPLNESQADEPYQEEFHFLKSNGVNCSLFNFDTLDFDEFNPKPRISNKEIILYRGWMLNPDQYKKLTGFINHKGATPLTSYENYIKCHHLPNWYEACSEYTPESHFFPDDEQLIQNVASLGWNSFFIKDFVKSNSTERGSIASTPEEVTEIVELIRTYRGEIEGGIAVRRVEKYNENTEIRYFAFNGKVYSPNDIVPDIVQRIANLIDAPFFSIDMIQREDGIYRLVEIGDGQVSDKKTWSSIKFSKMLLENAQ